MLTYTCLFSVMSQRVALIANGAAVAHAVPI